MMQASQLSFEIAESSSKKEEILKPLNDAQKAVVKDYQGFSVVSAGPGSGKEL